MMKRMNKQVYVAVLMALTTMSINSYACLLYTSYLLLLRQR